MTSSATRSEMAEGSVIRCPWSCVGGLLEPGEREEAGKGLVFAAGLVAARCGGGGGDVAHVGQRAELARAESLDEDVADGRGLDGAGEHLAAADVGRQLAEQFD